MMKKMIISFLFFLFLTTAVLPQNIPNRGFEVWKTYQLYEEPVSWVTSNAMSLLAGDSSLMARKTDEAASGDYAIFLESVVSDNDTFPAFALCAGVVAGDFPNLQFLGGFPYTGQPDSLTGYFMYDLPEKDTARILVVFKKEGQVLAESWFPLYGQQTTYRRIAFALPELSESPDTAFVGVAATSPWAPLPGGHLYADHLAFSEGESIPNGDFEEWQDLSYDDPEGWNSANHIAVATHSDIMCSSTTDAHSGEYALRLETVYLNILDDYIGVITTGEIGVESLSGGFPVQAAPTVVQGYYKYIPAGNDSAQMVVFCTKWNTQTNSRDEVIRFFTLPAADSYTFFSDTLYLGNSEIDTVNLVFASGWLFGAQNKPPAGSVLYLDDLWLVNACDYADTTQLFSFYDTTICAGDSITLDAGSGYAYYEWSDSSTTQSIRVADSGLYSVTVTDLDGCRITDAVRVRVDECTGRKETISPPAIRVYPNPCHEYLFVDLPAEAEGTMEVSVSNILGQRLFERKVVAGARDRIQVDMTGVAEGIYFTRIRWSGGEKVLKVIKR